MLRAGDLGVDHRRFRDLAEVLGKISRLAHRDEAIELSMHDEERRRVLMQMIEGARERIERLRLFICVGAFARRELRSHDDALDQKAKAESFKMCPAIFEIVDAVEAHAGR